MIPMPVVPEFAHEAGAIEALHRRGFDASFTAESGQVRVTGSTRRLRPEELRIRGFYRFEGASDPDDMSIVYALEARDGTRGVLVDAYGSYADPDVGAVLEHVPIDPLDAGGRRTRRRRMWWAGVAGGAVVGLAVVAALGARGRIAGAGRSPWSGQPGRKAA